MKIQNHAVQKIKEIETFLEIEVSYFFSLLSLLHQESHIAVILYPSSPSISI
jgi:hypothetical protein